MTTPLDRLRSEALTLDARERARLALDLLESLDTQDAASEVGKAWNLEARERLARYDAGDNATLSADDLHAGFDEPASPGGEPSAERSPSTPHGVDEAVTPTDLHRAQDLQSLLMHQEAVRLLRKNPSLTERLQQTLARWSLRDDPNSLPLHLRWVHIIETTDWDAALADTEEGRQLRQASPLATLLPEETRLAIIRRIKALKEGTRAST